MGQKPTFKEQVLAPLISEVRWAIEEMPGKFQTEGGLKFLT